MTASPQLSDENWSSIWKNTEETRVKEMCEIAKAVDTEIRRTKTMFNHYEKAIIGGAETMSCGRIGTIGKPQTLIKSPTGDTDAISRCTTSGGKLCDVNEVNELAVLATLANTVMKKDMNSDLKKIVVEAFSDRSLDAPNYMPTNRSDVSKRIKEIVAAIKKRSFADCASKPSTTPTTPITPPSLIHITNHSWEQLRHILPILITSRSLFLIAIDNTDTTSDGNDDEITSNVRRCIACINSSLSYKATTLFNNLLKKKSSLPQICPYPKILIVGTCTTKEQHTHTKSRINGIKKWVETHCSDSVQQRCEVIEECTTDQANDEVQKRVTSFIECDLKIPMPLSWELFRQMFSYITKNIPVLRIEVMAKLALLCDIKTEEFPSVLNFFHEHGAFLYYADVECLRNIVIVDPKWLQKNLCKILIPPSDHSLKHMWIRLLKYGILASSLFQSMWQSEEVEDLATGLVKLLITYHLAAPIEIQEEESDLEGPKYFLPFALQSKETPSPCPTSNPSPSELVTGSIHFIFPKTKYLPLGVFTYLNVALAKSKDFHIDFKIEMFSNQITYWYNSRKLVMKRDKVILSETLTSISVVVERVKCCGKEYKTKNFWLTCRKIVSSLKDTLDTVLKNSFKDVQASLAFHCTCLPEGILHYVHIDLETESTCNTLRCEANNDYTLQANEQLWLKMGIPSFEEGKLLKCEIDGLIQLLKPEDHDKLIQALEIDCRDTDINFKTLSISCWIQDAGPDARKHLMYHLKRLGLERAEYYINYGVYLDRKGAVKQLFIEVGKVFQTYYSELIHQLNPDDIAAELYSRKIITSIEKQKISNQMLTTFERNQLLLDTLNRNDVHTVTAFLEVLDDISKYKDLAGRIRDEMS